MGQVQRSNYTTAGDDLKSTSVRKNRKYFRLSGIIITDQGNQGNLSF